MTRLRTTWLTGLVLGFTFGGTALAQAPQLVDEPRAKHLVEALLDRPVQRRAVRQKAEALQREGQRAGLCALQRR